MLNRSTLNFHLGLGLPAAALILTLSKLTHRAIAPLTVFSIVFILSATFILWQRVSSFKDRLALAVGPITIALLTHVLASTWLNLQAGYPPPLWLLPFKGIVPIGVGALLALAIAAASGPIKQRDRRTMPDPA